MMTRDRFGFGGVLFIVAALAADHRITELIIGGFVFLAIAAFVEWKS